MITLKEAKVIVDSGKGIYGNKYRDALEILAQKHRNDPCPAELTKTKVLIVDGVECKVFYNYVPPYGIGMTPTNHWWGVASTGRYIWKCPLGEEIKTLEGACERILPIFTEVVRRWREKVG